VTDSFQVAALPDKVYRVSKFPDAWKRKQPDRGLSPSTARYDDPLGLYGTLYAASTLYDAYVAALATFRPRLGFDLTSSIEENDPGLAGTPRSSEAVKKWISRHYIGEATLDGLFIDLTDERTIGLLCKRLPKTRVDVERLTVDYVRKAPRNITMEISRYTYEYEIRSGLHYDGVSYGSRLFDGRIRRWAVYDDPGLVLKEKSSRPIDLNDPELLRALQDCGITEADSKERTSGAGTTDEGITAPSSGLRSQVSTNKRVDIQSASLLEELAIYRDALTERFLRPPELRSNELISQLPLDIDRYDVIEGLVGFGIGRLKTSSSPALTIFLESKSAHSSALQLVSALQSLQIPTIIQTNSRFLAAARPLKGGQSIGIGLAGGETGTMGCVVTCRSEGTRFALTCNHVIADLNAAQKGHTDVWAPGARNSGTVRDRLGVLHDFADIDFNAGVFNVIDAAIAKPNNPADLDTTIDQIGTVSGINSAPVFGAAIYKMGVTTGYTTGTYQFDINTIINFAGGKAALFRDLLGIVGTTAGQDFGAQGDSGAVLVDDENAVVGQVISVASGIDLTLATRIQPVLDRFQVDIE
jgi:hypothetical protein